MVTFYPRRKTVQIQTGTFDGDRPEGHRWFRLYKFRPGGYELWFGNHWISIEWGKK